ncbi:hypothetical protein ABZ924_28320 [Streptomyces sp. NPDC046876]|uniref:hypothetical protein n=1 Tax=Streptomyces sp. NPDC046876 TaxID=3155616 RepID=UPI0033CD3FD5
MVTLRIQGLARPEADGLLLLPETACIRLVAQLPPQWRTTQQMEAGRFTLDVRVPDGGDPKSARQTIEQAFRDPGLRDWTWAERPAH